MPVTSMNDDPELGASEHEGRALLRTNWMDADADKAMLEIAEAYEQLASNTRRKAGLA